MVTGSDSDRDGVNLDADELARRRRNARRTAAVLGVIVLAIFTAFMITGITGRG